MLCRGYKLNGYDVTYKKATFSIVEKQDGVLEITDTESGVTFILDLEDLSDAPERPTRRWRTQESAGHGVSIAFGSKGWYQKLKYGNRKRKEKTD